MFSRCFPLKSCHNGAMLGNGLAGLLVWGGGRSLRITVGRADLWDHRGGLIWSEKQSLKEISAILNSSHPEKIGELFPPSDENSILPSVLPFGRIEVTLPEYAELERYDLHLDDGKLEIFYSSGIMQLRIGMTHDHAFALQNVPQGSSVKVIPAWDLTEEMRRRGIPEPERRASGFRQNLPADAPCFLEVRQQDGELQGISGRSGTVEFVSFAKLEKDNLQWWEDFYESAPEISLANPALQEEFEVNLYKAGAMCCHLVTPPGLQGPWIEDDHLPPWGSDYHFNINVQMCFMWAFKAGKSRVLLPLFRLMESWKDTLRHNAQCFAGVAGIMLPHAVDDRGRCMGNFWSGAVDHGCTAWMAQMMFEYVRYTGDAEFLKNTAFPFMKGAMALYEKMLEKQPDGTLFLPLSVSPEYGGNAPDAWGINASFQLAAIHRLAQNLAAAAQMLGEECNPFWHEVEEKLPQAELQDGEIALWRGKVLEESHRHHSHLASIFPFDTLDAEDPAWQEILLKSLERWTRCGTGIWTGWAFAWAAMLFCRMHNPLMAEYALEVRRKFFTNTGGGSLHDPVASGFSVINFGQGREIMQMDGALGALSAVQDMLFFESRGVCKFFYGVPEFWEFAKFRNFSMPGKIKVSGLMEKGKSKFLELMAEEPCTLHITVPDGKEFLCDGNKIRTIQLKAGQVCRLTPEKEEFL